MKKRIFSLILAVAMVMSLAACGSSKETAKDDTKAAETTKALGSLIDNIG